MKNPPFLFLALCAAMVFVGPDSKLHQKFSSPATGLGSWGPETRALSKPLFNQFKDAPSVWTAGESWDLLTEKLNFCDSNRWNRPEDSIYIAPTQEDIDDLLVFILHRRENLGYIPEANDCDDLATEAKYWATVWSVRRYDRTQGALFFGKAYVKLNGDYTLLFPKLKNTPVFGYHVLNWFVRADGKIFFFEPQTDCVAPIESFVYEGSIEILKLEY